MSKITLFLDDQKVYGADWTIECGKEDKSLVIDYGQDETDDAGNYLVIACRCMDAAERLATVANELKKSFKKGK